MRSKTWITAVVAAASIVAVGPATASAVTGTPSTPISDGGVTPYIIDGASDGGNRTCAEVGAAFEATFDYTTVKQDYQGNESAAANGTWAFSWVGEGATGFVTVTVTDGTYVAFDSEGPLVGAAIVKGSNEANVYYYPDGVDSDSGLASPPPNAESMSPAGLSNLTFCGFIDPEDEFVESLDVTKTAFGNYTRTHNWDIDKSVDPAEINLYAPYWPNTPGTDTDSADWTIDVDYLGAVDSAWNISGTITILNDGDLIAPIQSVTDALSAYADAVEVTCEDDAGEIVFPYDLAVGETIECTYSVGVDGLFDSENTATVTTLEEIPYTDTVDVTWNDPTQVNETVTLTDDNGTPDDTSDDRTFEYTAPAEGLEDLEFATESYDAIFTWDEEYDDTQDDCGSRQIANTAKLFGDDADEALDSDDATLDINVQCVEFNDETAWASRAAGVDKYNTRRGNWATWVAYADAAKTVNLYAGQTLLAGTVSLGAVNNGFVTITLDLADGFVFDDVFSNFKVQGYSTAPTGNPVPGDFANKTTCDVESDTCSITVPDANYYGIHADLVNIIPDPLFGT
jgi:hypothetical protein